MSAAASAATSPEVTRRPVSPSLTVSGIPPTRVATTGRLLLIASSTDTHAELIQRGAAAGKAIFCEKPVDLDLVRARACAQAVGKTGVVCMIGFQRRFDPTFAAHYTALSTNVLLGLTGAARATQVRQLVAYLLSIDETTTAVPPPALGYDARLCPATL